MKKVLAIMLSCLVALCVLSGCSGTTTSEESAQAPDSSQPAADAESSAGGDEPYTVNVNGYDFTIDPSVQAGDLEIALVYANITTPFASYLKMGIDDLAAEYGVNAYMTAPTTWSTENEIEMVENLVAKGVDGLAVMVLDQDAMEPIINAALEAGIPTICWNVDCPNSDRLGFIGEDLYLAGQETARALVDAMGEEGKVLITSEDQSTYHSQQREKGARDYLADYPNIEVMDTLDCQGADDEGMYAKIEAMMVSTPDINGVISTGGTCYVLSQWMEDNNIGNASSDSPIYNTGHDLREEKVQQMNSRERVLMACNHKEADRVPIDCGSMRSTGLSAITVNKLKEYLNLDIPCLLYDYQQQLAYTGDALRERFHVDSMDIGEAFIGDIKTDWKPWKLSDGSSCLVPKYMDLRMDGDETVYYDADGIEIGRMPPDAVYPAQTYFPYGDRSEIPAELDEAVYSHTFWNAPCLPFHLNITGNKEDYRKFIHTVKNYREKSDKALMICIGHSFFETGGFIRKQDNWLCDIMVDPTGTERLLKKLEEGYLEKLDAILSDLWDDIDIIQFGDDLGTQRGPWMDPQDIKRIFIPHYKALWDYVHQHSKAKVFMHSCGDISSVLGYLIDSGLDIINPVQTSAANMDPVMLKKTYGKDVTFWGGGCEVQGILTDGTPQEVADQVKRRMEIFGKDGGFVFNQIHNVLANVPVENIVAMFDTAYEFGSYSN